MGSNLACYIEFKDKDSTYWNDFGGRMTPDNWNWDYTTSNTTIREMDKKLAENPRGLPDELGCSARCEQWVPVCDGQLPREVAEDWIARGLSEYKDEIKFFVSSKNFHNRSWVTADEFEAAIDGNDNVEYRAILNTLRFFEGNGKDARLIICFVRANEP